MTSRGISQALALTALAALTAGCSSLSHNMNLPALSSQYTADTKFKVARAQEQQGKLPEALELYMKLYNGGRTDAAICHRLAVVYARMGNHKQADAFFRRALKQEPRNAELLCDYGYALSLRNELKAAEQLLQQALRTRPMHKRSLNNLAAVMGKQGRFDECLRTYRRVVSNAQAHANVAYIHAQRGEGSLAVKHYSRALSLNPNLVSAANAMVQLSQVEQRFLKTKRGRQLLAKSKNNSSLRQNSTPKPVRTADVEVVDEPAPRVTPTRQATVSKPDKPVDRKPAPVTHVSHDVVDSGSQGSAVRSQGSGVKAPTTHDSTTHHSPLTTRPRNRRTVVPAVAESTPQTPAKEESPSWAASRNAAPSQPAEQPQAFPMADKAPIAGNPKSGTERPDPRRAPDPTPPFDEPSPQVAERAMQQPDKPVSLRLRGEGKGWVRLNAE